MSYIYINKGQNKKAAFNNSLLKMNKLDIDRNYTVPWQLENSVMNKMQKDEAIKSLKEQSLILKEKLSEILENIYRLENITKK